MSWTAPVTWLDGSVLTAAQLNTYLRDNLLETAAAKSSHNGGLGGGYFATVAKNAIAERGVTMATLGSTTQTTSSTTYTDLVTKGPGVTTVTGEKALVFFGGAVRHGTAGGQASISVEVNGASDIPADDQWCLYYERAGAINSFTEWMRSYLFEGLTPGENTFVLKYKTSSGGVAGFASRKLVVLPL